MNPFTPKPAESVAALGELKLIASIRRWLGDASPASPFGIGDDCAVLPASSRRQLVTVDPVIYQNHFDDTVSARAAGEKLLKRNLSDIAAMGGRPRAAVIALALDPTVRTRWLADFYRGLAAAARRHGVPIVGGDVAQHTGGLVATLTLIGEASARVLTRHGASAGDWIYVTGTLGGSILGHHHRFTPRLAEGKWLASRREVRSLLDLSDGLAKDVQALAPAGTVPALEGASIPISPAALQCARRSGRPPLHHALEDGEDYELLFTVSARADLGAFEAAWKRKFKTRLTRIGRFSRKPAAGDIDLKAFHGYEHLR
ncbi:MAG: thiamine-monophosphate kinase [Verrucomicrobia bacterium]|nr:thiamine-monophosphate kinase [Verrucomicrobiota bacterium]